MSLNPAQFINKTVAVTYLMDIAELVLVISNKVRIGFSKDAAFSKFLLCTQDKF